MSAAEKIAEDFSLPSLARAALKDAGGDTDAATASLVERCMTDAVLLRAIIHSAVSTAANYMVEHSMRNERASIYRASRRDEEVVTPIRPSNASQALLARAAAENAVKRMLDMPLANGAKLGEAEIMAAAGRAGRRPLSGVNPRWSGEVACRPRPVLHQHRAGPDRRQKGQGGLH